TDRRLLEQQFHQAQKMEAIGRLAGGVAHDFNNLLTAILGYSDMALEKLPPNSQAKRYTAEIKKAGERAALLTRQLLAYSRLQVMSPQVIDLNAVIVEMSKMLRRLAGEDIVLATIPNASPGRIRSDPSQIEQVIMNLAVNARDAMPQGGKLTIKTSDSVLEEAVTAEGLRVKGGHYVQLDVSDTGCGMDAETRPRIFDPFFTTKERGKGTGLGLSTVYGIVKQSSGYIWVKSEPSRGTTFSIYLPAVAENLSEEKPAGARAQKHRGTETILVVEDEDSVRQVLGKILAGMGYQVITAPKGDEALQICEQHKHAIHLMLTDIAMPRMKGQELAHRVAKIHPETKVLFMTGYAGNKVGAIDVLETGSYFLSKPFTAEALGQMVRRILSRTR
ncbi:MAG: response regulator, partial [Acidobacteriota bacterium]|nr:response regulator [Acidobacteriota bacterium]